MILAWTKVSSLKNFGPVLCRNGRQFAPAGNRSVMASPVNTPPLTKPSAVVEAAVFVHVVPSLVVTVADPRFAHKITGGRIVPKLRKWLIIPLREEAYALSGKGSVSESRPDLFPITTKRGSYLVRNLVESRGRGKLRNSRLEFWFRLVKSVDQPADPTAMPPMAEIEQGVERAARTVLPLLLKS